MKKYRYVLALMDTSPSMTARDIASAQVMLRELVSELKASAANSGSPILFSMLYRTETEWKASTPDRIENIQDIPSLQVLSPENARHFHRIVIYMCCRLMETKRIWDSRIIEDIKLLYFGSGRLPKEALELRGVFPRDKLPEIMDSPRCQRYLICTAPPDFSRLDPVLHCFAQDREHVITADGFSDLLGSISTECAAFQSFF